MPANSTKNQEFILALDSHYQSIIDKEIDFVLNPAILESVIQVMYELKLTVNREEDNLQQPDKEYILISPSGELKVLKIE